MRKGLKARRDGERKGLAALLGDALRHCRRAAELNLRDDGPTAAVGDAVQQAHDALDSAALLCERARAEGSS